MTNYDKDVIKKNLRIKWAETFIKNNFKYKSIKYNKVLFKGQGATSWNFTVEMDSGVKVNVICRQLKKISIHVL